MLVPVVAILLVMIPVAGLTLGLTLRFAVRPFVETLAHVLRDLGSGGEMDLLLNEVEALRVEVGRLRDERAFDEKLLGR